ncbi:MAG: ABC transporter substrate-binding protein [Cryobacterium sp.]|nr:ABC transporter substrate-binding protein [Cryobacterium sp.]
MRKTRSVAVAAGLASLALVVTACSSTPAGEGEGDPIIIGHAADFSGDYSFYDSPMRAGAELAIDEINKAGGVLGRPLEYRAIDGRDDQAETLRATEELLDAGAVYLIGTTGSPWAAQATLSCEAGVPISTGDGTSPDLVGQIGECAHHVIMSDNVQAAVAAEYALEQGWTTAFVMRSSDDPYTDGVPNYFTDTFTQGGGTIVGETEFRIGAGDYNVQATEIANLPEQPDFIFTPIFVSDTQVFLRQLRAQGVTTQVVGADGAVDASVLDAGDAAEGLIATFHAWPNDGDARIAKFIDDYTAFHGSAPESMVAGLGYDEIYLIAQIIEAQGEASAEAIIRGLADAQFTGVTGSLTMDPTTRRANKEITLVKIENGEIVYLDSLSPKHVPAVPGD